VKGGAVTNRRGELTKFLVIGVDLGTTAIKCAVYEDDGTLVSSVTREYTLLTPSAGTVEVHPATYWNEFSSAIHVLLGRPGVDAGRIAAIGISAQGETLIPLRADGAAARNAIVWLDGRATAEAAFLAERFGERLIYETTGQPAMLPTWPAAKVLWIARHEPRTFEKTAQFLLIEDYFLWRLTGEFVSEGSLLTSTCYWDFRSKQWWPEMLDVLGIERSRLPAIVEPGTVVGTLLPAVASELGLKTSTTICTGALDNACGAIGVNNVRPGRFSESTGACVALCATLNGARLDPSLRMPCHYHGVPDTYMFHTFTSGGIVLRWFRDQFGEEESSVARALGRDAYDLLTDEASRIPAGAEGLVLLPHLQGAMAPESNPNARGVIVGLSLRHGRAHLARAILESIAFVVRRNIEVLENLDVHVSEIRALGGGARSSLWKQIEADVTKRPVVTTQQPDAATLGAAILAGVGVGAYSSVEEAAEYMVRIDQVFEPQPELGEIYDETYAAYQETYENLRPVFNRLAKT
jgi:sugar (pentulose or hexulose) kinase